MPDAPENLSRLPRLRAHASANPATPLKVLHVFGELRHSGGEVMMNVAARLWAEHRIECEIVAVAAEVGTYARVLEDSGYRVHRVPPSSPRLLLDFPRLLRSARPDVVHIHTERANFWLALEALASGALVVRTVHSSFPFTGLLRAERTVQRVLLRRLGVRTVAVGPSVGLQEWQVFHNPASIILNWCDLEEFCPTTAADRDTARRALGIREHDRVLISVGNCSSIKNHELIIRAMAMAPTPPAAVYLHVGDDGGDDGARERELVATLGVGDRVQFLGPVDNVSQVLKAADLFVMPSRYEGIPISAMEAVASGTPTLVADVPGLRDLAALSDAIETVEPVSDPSRLAFAIASCLQDEKRVDRPAQLRTAAERWFSPARGVGQYDDLYRLSDSARAPAIAPAKVAVLLASHNRRSQTLACLESLHANAIEGVQVRVYLVDDASSDGTDAAVRAAYPRVEITAGTGDLFWGGAMRLAFSTALSGNPDYMLWLNDDVVLDHGALEHLLKTHAALCAQRQPLSIIAGATRNPQGGATTYGGVRRAHMFRRMRFVLVPPTTSPEPCDTMNGNVVLVPRSVYSVVGNIDGKFTQSMGDFDYGLRARSAGCRVFLAPGRVATCGTNPSAGSYRDEGISRRERLRVMGGPKGLPFAEWTEFCRRHGGPLWPALALSPYFRTAMGRSRPVALPQ